jgi:hypothetical protein
MVLLAAGLAVLAVGIGIAGARRQQHLQGTNHVQSLLVSAIALPGQAVCQPGETVPAGTGAIRVRVGSDGLPGPQVDVSFGGQALRGRLAAGWQGGDVVIALPKVAEDLRGVPVCFSNHGPARLSLAGAAFPPASAARVGEAPQPGRVRVEYLRPGKESWWSLAPTLGDRVATVRSAPPGSLTPYLWVLLVLGVAGGALALVLREGRA